MTVRLPLHRTAEGPVLSVSWLDRDTEAQAWTRGTLTLWATADGHVGGFRLACSDGAAAEGLATEYRDRAALAPGQGMLRLIERRAGRKFATNAIFPDGAGDVIVDVDTDGVPLQIEFEGPERIAPALRSA